MPITTGQNADPDDFITYAARDVTPANDSGRVPKFEADGQLHPFFTRTGEVLTAGETLAGATTPVPVYQNKTDNELYACDANDNTKYKFIGFVISSSTDGNPIAFQGSGIVSGFSGLSEGEKYYVQDAAGTIGTSPGTQEILVGVAISETDLLIVRGGRHASGVASFSATGTSAITTGFRPSLVRVKAISAAGSLAQSDGSYSASGGQKCAYYSAISGGTTNTSTSYAWYISGNTSNPDHQRGTITSVTDTGFTLSNSKSGTIADVLIYWEAIGEL